MVSSKVHGKRRLTLRIAFGITALVLLLAGGAGAATNINACRTISEAGEYVLNQSIGDVSTCITINQSNVILDGAGYTITGSGVKETYGVYVHQNLTILENVTVKNLIVKNWYDGINYFDEANGNITDNIAGPNINNGIDLYHSSSNNLIDNIANSNENTGISLYNSSSNNLIGNIVCSNGDYGIYLFSLNSNLTGNTACANGLAGIFLYNSRNNTINDNTAPYNTGWAFKSINDSINNTVINLTINPTISFTGKDIAINVANAPDFDPDGYRNISIFLRATNNSPDSWLFLNVSYNDDEIAGINENTLRIWQHDDVWSQVTVVNGVNTDQNYVYANITSFSVFAPMGASGGTITGTAAAVPVTSETGTVVLIGMLTVTAMVMLRKRLR